MHYNMRLATLLPPVPQAHIPRESSCSLECAESVTSALLDCHEDLDLGPVALNHQPATVSGSGTSPHAEEDDEVLDDAHASDSFHTARTGDSCGSCGRSSGDSGLAVAEAAAELQLYQNQQQLQYKKQQQATAAAKLLAAQQRLGPGLHVPTVCSDVSSPRALALANEVMSRVRIPGACFAS